MGKNKRNNKHKHANAASATASTTTNKEQQAPISGSTSTSTSGSNNKSNTKSNGLKLPNIPERDRKTLNQLAQSIFDLVQQQPGNANDEWKQYVELQRLLDHMMQLEKPLQRLVCPPDESNVSEETRLAKVAAFDAWARKGGVKSDAVEIATFPGYQLGLRATRDIAADEQVLSVPRELIFSEEHLPEALRSLFINFPLLTNLNLAHALVIEKVRGAASTWQPYIDTLPSRYNTVLYFTVEQMQRLRGTSACSAALRQCRVIARQYASMYKCAQVQHDDGVMSSMGVLFTEYGLCYEIYR